MILEYLTRKIKSILNNMNISVLEYAYKQLEFVEDASVKQQLQNRVDLKTDIDYDFIDKIREETEEISQHSMAIRQIIHHILKFGANGNDNMTHEKWAMLLATSMLLDEVSLTNELSRKNLQGYEVEVTQLFEIENNFGELVFSNKEYSERLIEFHLNKLKMNSAGEDIKLIDASYKEIFDFSLFDLVNVLTLISRSNFPSRQWYPINFLDMDYFIENIVRDSGIESNIVKQIIDYLSLDFNSFEEINYISNINLMRWKQRINLCPIIRYKENVIYGNSMCLKAANLWLKYYAEGDVPYTKDLPKKINNASKKIHRQLDLKLEAILEKEAGAILGKENVEANIDNFRRLSNRFPAKPDCGEIDLLAINRNTKTLFVIDAKNINKRLRPYDIAQEMDHFFNEKDGYLTKLINKENFIIKNLRDVLGYFNISDESGWKIKKAFFLDNIFPSAFVKKDISFIIIDQLANYLLG